uniref:Uncharacterized protein n=1 Tax=Arundo donax TaxID=35708 RepID=A0A0A9BQG3_ARUDO
MRKNRSEHQREPTREDKQNP